MYEKIKNIDPMDLLTIQDTVLPVKLFLHNSTGKAVVF